VVENELKIDATDIHLLKMAFELKWNEMASGTVADEEVQLIHFEKWFLRKVQMKSKLHPSSSCVCVLILNLQSVFPGLER
jgi:hypothetical protein